MLTLKLIFLTINRDFLRDFLLADLPSFDNSTVLSEHPNEFIHN